MVYIPLSWQFVNEVLGGTVSFDTEKGLEVRVDNSQRLADPVGGNLPN